LPQRFRISRCWRRTITVAELRAAVSLLARKAASGVSLWLLGVRVVGIDPGLAACGYGVVDTDAGQLRAVDYGSWHTRAGRRLELRLHELFERLIDLLARSGAQAVALEESFVGRDARGALSIGQVRGALIVACAQAGVECVEYPPARVKQAVCGYGLAEKAQVQRMAKALLRLEATPTPSHAADALAVAICLALAPPLLREASSSHSAA
jgi:crossover junction endodeoxyribonuclease RuvC